MRSVSTELDKIHILIVDDQEDLALGLKDMLELHKPEYLVETAVDIQQALDVVAREVPILAILDIRLGHQNGLDLLARLKKDYPQIVCIMLTGYRDEEYAARAVVEGADDYLHKPIHETQFLTLIDDYVDQAISSNRTSRLLEALKFTSENISVLFDSAGVVVDFSDRLSARVSEAHLGDNSESVTGRKFWSLDIFNGNENELQSLFSQAKSNGSASHDEMNLTGGLSCDVLIRKVPFQDGDIYALEASMVDVGKYLKRRMPVDQTL